MLFDLQKAKQLSRWWKWNIMDPYNQQGGSCSSNGRAATSSGRRNNKHKQAVVKPEQEQPSTYRLFPEDDSGLYLHQFFAADQRQHPQQLHQPNRLLQVYLK